MTSAARTPDGETPNDRPRQPESAAPSGAGWSRRPQEPAPRRESHTPLSQADGHP